MKKIFTLALMLLSVAAFAQINRTKLPEPAPAKEIKIGDYEKFTLKNGLTVILAENNKLPTISWTLSLNTGPITEGDKGGYAGIFGQVMRAGTTSKTKEVLNEEIDFMGASVSVGATSISGFSLSKYREEVLSIMTDILYNPSFPEDEFERAIEQTLTGLKQAQDNPDAISGNVSGVLNYGKDHPYGELITEKTVGNITLDDLKAHYNKFFKPNIGYLVIVGDINKKDAQKLVKEYFGDWEKGDVEKEAFQMPAPIETTQVAIVDKPSSVQSVINITYPIVNKPGNPDATTISVMNNILGGTGSARLFMNLREDKGYTYGAYSSLGSSRYSATFSANSSVRNDVTDSSLVQFMYELNKIRMEPVSAEELTNAKNYLRGSFSRSLENRSTVASFALNTELNNLPADYYATYLKRLEAITVEDVQRVANKVIKPENANIVVVGKAEDIADKLEAFGEVKFYDYLGNEVDDPTNVEIDASVSVESILNKYIEAIGGKAAVDAIETLQYSSKATLSMGGQSLELTRNVYQKSPDKYLDETIIPMMGAQKQIYNAGAGKVEAGGQTQAIPEAGLPPLKYLGVMFPERFYDDLGYKTEYKGVVKVDGNDAHRVDVNIDGFTIMEFYDVASGLKVQADLGQNGKYTMSDYREVNGVKIPFNLVVRQAAIPAPLEFITSEAKANEAIDDSKFE